MGHESRAGIKDGKEEEDEVWCFHMNERQSSTEQIRRLRVEAIGGVMRKCRLRWHGGLDRKDDADYVKPCARMMVAGKRTPGRTVCLPTCVS